VQPTEPEQLQICLFDLIGDPTVRSGRIGASIDHPFRVEVEAHMESPERPAEGAADLKTTWGNHPPFGRRPPGKSPLRKMHWEHASSIARQDRACCQIPTDRDDVVGASRPRVRKAKRTGDGFDWQARTFQQNADATRTWLPLALRSLLLALRGLLWRLRGLLWRCVASSGAWVASPKIKERPSPTRSTTSLPQQAAPK
jgi:hypothetical protein